MSGDKRAPCAGKSGLWYAVDVDAKREAARLCAECPIRLECGQLALDLGADDGVWAGFNCANLSGRRALQKWLDAKKTAPAREPLPARKPLPVRTCECGREFATPFTKCVQCSQGLRDAAPVRDHVTKLRASMTREQITEQARISRTTLQNLMRPTKRYVDPEIAERILAVQPAAEKVPA